MFESKYSKVLTVILIIVVVAIIGLLGYLGVDYYMNYINSSEAQEFVNNFQSGSTDFDDFEGSGDEEQKEEKNTELNWGDLNLSDGNQTPSEQQSSSTTQSKKPQYKGFDMLGTISIPATNCDYPILERNTTATLNTGIVFIWGAGINKTGNTVLAGHNYRNGTFFSNNKKLNIGDKIYLTDNNKQKLTYTIYNKFETTDSDSSFYQRDTNGKAEITLSTCTDDGKNRLIILAKQN